VIEASPETKPELDTLDDVLHHWIERERQEPGGAHGDATAARLVTWEAGAIDEQDRRSGPGQVERRRGPGRPGSDDDGVEALDAASLTAAPAKLSRPPLVGAA
jgi:hypothetical protein